MHKELPRDNTQQGRWGLSTTSAVLWQRRDFRKKTKESNETHSYIEGMIKRGQNFKKVNISET